MTVPLHVETSGPDGAPALVLLNSIGSSSGMWDAQIGALSEQFRVIRMDARGHGQSPPAPGRSTSIADLGNDVLAALDRLGVQRAHVAGVSLGGMTALWLAAHRPERVGRLAVLCSSANPTPVSTWVERAAAVREGGTAAIADAVVARWITPELGTRDPDLRARLVAMVVGVDAETYAQGCDVLATLDLRPDLPRISAPTLVVAGAADVALPVEHSRTIAGGIAGARLEMVPGAHIAPVEDAGAVTRLLLEHFGGGATLAAGYATRRAVLGDAHVERALAATTEFTAAFQQFLTRYAWGDVWSRPGLARRDRSLVTLAALVALGAEHELAMHVRAAVRNGVTRDEIAEALMHAALYVGLPRANRAFAVASRVLDEPSD